MAVSFRTKLSSHSPVPALQPMPITGKIAMKSTYPRGRGALTVDKARIYIKEEDGGEKLLGVVTHKHIRKYAPMYDEC